MIGEIPSFVAVWYKLSINLILDLIENNIRFLNIGLKLQCKTRGYGGLAPDMMT